MKKITLLLMFLSVLCTLDSQAQLLWKITGNGLSKTSYIFGTHHLIESKQIPTFSSVVEIMKSTDAVVGELDMSNPEMQSIMLQAGIMKGTNIKDLIADKDYRFIDSTFMQLSGVSLAMLGNFKPMFISSYYTVSLYLKTHHISIQPQPIDAILQTDARKAGKKVIGLETIEEQVAILFDSISIKRQAEILISQVREPAKSIESLEQMNRAYLNGDLLQMELLDAADSSSTPREKRLLNDNRNARWLGKLTPLMQEQSCFIAVGFLHFTGERGLIKELQRQGYVVEPVVITK